LESIQKLALDHLCEKFFPASECHQTNKCLHSSNLIRTREQRAFAVLRGNDPTSR
jgi:hypothetical protein